MFEFTPELLDRFDMSATELAIQTAAAEREVKLKEYEVRGSADRLQSYQEEVERRRAAVSNILGKEITSQEYFQLSGYLR